MASATALVITLAQLPGYLAAAVLVERWGRRPTLAAFLLGSAASATLFGFAHGPAAVVGYGVLLSFFNLGAWGALYALTPEVYWLPEQRGRSLPEQPLSA